MKFTYKVRTRHNKYLSGVMEAMSRGNAIFALLDQGYSPILVQEVKPWRINISLDFGLKRVKTRDLLAMTRQLGTMITAGLTLLRCLTILEQQTTNRTLQEAICEIKKEVAEGVALWAALGKHPNIFSTVYVSMVKVGEMGGRLDTVLEKLCLYLEREEQISRRVKAASIYPGIVASCALLMLVFLSAFIMPTFVSMFQSPDIELPLPTRMVMAASQFIADNWQVLSLGLLMVFATIKQVGKTAGGKRIVDKLSLHVPLVGKTLSRIIAARFARTMGILVAAGVPILPALEVLEGIAGNAVVGEAIAGARLNITKGESIARPLADSGVFEPIITQMIAVGEATGSLDRTLVSMSDHFDREVLFMIDSLLALLEPVLIVLVAVLVGVIVAATLLPILQLSTTLS